MWGAESDQLAASLALCKIRVSEWVGKSRENLHDLSNELNEGCDIFRCLLHGGAHSICGAWIESFARCHSMGHSMCGKHCRDVYQVTIASGSHRICKRLTMKIGQELEPSCSHQRNISPQLLSTYIQILIITFSRQRYMFVHFLYLSSNKC